MWTGIRRAAQCLALLSLLAASAGCKGPAAAAPLTCANGMIEYYLQPGCGSEAKAQCSAPPPCVEPYCSCEGKTVSGCGGTNVPWRAAGACAP